MLKKLFMSNALKPITELLKEVLKLFKDNKGKWSSKRTISGVLVIVCATEIERSGISTNALILSFIAILPLCFSVFEKSSE